MAKWGRPLFWVKPDGRRLCAGCLRWKCPVRFYGRAAKCDTCHSRMTKDFLKANPLIRECYRIYNHAVRTGLLVRGPCEVCGKETGIDGHHDDHSKPLEVRWLCRSHHRKHHWNVRKAKKKAAA